MEMSEIEAITKKLSSMEGDIRHIAIKTRGEHPRDIDFLRDKAVNSVRAINLYCNEILDRMAGGV